MGTSNSKDGNHKRSRTFPSFRRKRKLSASVEDEGERVDDLRQAAGTVSQSVGQHDRDLVEDFIKNVEWRFGEAHKKTKRQQQIYEMLVFNYENLMKEIDGYLTWLKEKDVSLADHPLKGYQVKEAETRLQEHQAVCRDIESKQAMLETVNRQGEGLLRDLTPTERQEVEARMQEVLDRQKRLSNAATLKKNRLSKCLEEREEFQMNQEKVAEWIEDKEHMISKLDHPRLLSVDIEKQIEKQQSVLSDILLYDRNLSEVASQASDLQADCDDENKAQLETVITDLHIKYERVKMQLQEYIDSLRDHMTIRKRYESDILKVELWVKETEIFCSTDLDTDCSIDALDEQIKKHKGLLNAARVFESLVKDLEKRGEDLTPDLSEADKLELDEHLRNLWEKLKGIKSLVTERQDILQGALSSRSQLEDEILENTRWLSVAQDEMKRLLKPVGHRVTDAQRALANSEKLQDKLVAYKPSIEKLNQAKQDLLSCGQTVNEEELSRVNTSFNELMKQVAQQCNKLRQDVDLREEYEASRVELESCLKECLDQVDAIEQPGVSTPAKLDRCKAVSELLQSCDPLVQTLDSKAQLLALEGTGADSRAVNEKVHALKVKAENAAKNVEKKLKESDKIMRERDAFEKDLDASLVWLDQTEAAVQDNAPLSMDIDTVDANLDRHHDVAADILDKIANVEKEIDDQKSQYMRLEEAMPLHVSEKIEQLQEKREIIKSKLEEKANQLSEAKIEREEFDSLTDSVTTWLDSAGKMLASNYEGIDYDNVSEELEELQKFFAEEEKCQDQLDQLVDLAETITPSLDTNDTATVKQTLSNVNHRLGSLVSKANVKQGSLQTEAENWKKFHDDVDQLQDILNDAETRWETLEHSSPSDLDQAQTQAKETKEFLSNFQEKRPLVDELNELARQLERKGDSASRNSVNRKMGQVLERWNTMTTKAENSKESLESLASEWANYMENAKHLSEFVDEMESKMATPNIGQMTAAELEEHLKNSKSLHSDIMMGQEDMNTFQKSGESLLLLLPPGDEKKKIKQHLYSIKEQYDKLQDALVQSQQKVEREVQDRKVFQAEIKDTITWLQSAQAALQDPAMSSKKLEQVQQALGKHQSLQREMAVKLELVKSAIIRQNAKYGTNDVPSEMRDQVHSLRMLEANVLTDLEVKEQELKKAQQQRTEFDDTMKLVSRWLDGTNDRLHEQVEDVDVSKDKHQEVCEEFQLFATKKDQLNKRCIELSEELDDPVEKQGILSKMADLNRRWLNAQEKMDSRTQQLNEAAELWDTFDEALQFVNTWMEKADEVLKTELVWTSLNRVNAQHTEYETLVQQVDEFESRLEEMNDTVLQLAEVCEANSATEKYGEIKEHWLTIKSDLNKRHLVLKETAQDWQTYEDDMASLAQWIDDTKSTMEDRDSTLDLKEQLAVQEKLINDIQSHHSKVLSVLAEHSELRSIAGDRTPTHGNKLAGEIGKIEEAAKTQQEQLVRAIRQQEKYDQEVLELSALIQDAQEKLVAKPVSADSVDDIKQQMVEHNALTAKIKSYQVRIDDINTLSQKLNEKMTKLQSPRLQRKRVGPSSERSFASGSTDTGLDSVAPESYQGSSESVFASNISPPLHPPQTLEITERKDSGFMSPDGSITTPILAIDGSTMRPYSPLKSQPLASDGSSAAARAPLTEEVLTNRPRSDTKDTVDSSKTVSEEEIMPSKVQKKELGPLSIEVEHLGPVSPVTSKEQRSPGSIASDLTDELLAATFEIEDHSDDEHYVTGESTLREMETPKASVTPEATRPASKTNVDPLLLSPGAESQISIQSPSEVSITLSGPQRLRDSSASPFSEASSPTLSRSPRPASITDLNQSWNTLQLQLGNKERELQAALERQEDYQQALQDVSTRLEEAQGRLEEPTSVENVEAQLHDHEKMMKAIAGLKKDIVKMKASGQEMMPQSDEESQKAMDATLTVLSDRVDTLTAQAANKEKLLESLQEDKEKHSEVLDTYNSKLDDLKDWLAAKQSATPIKILQTDPEVLEEQAKENKALQTEMNDQLKELADLGVQCDMLCELESVEKAEILRSQLSALQSEITDLKLAALEHQGQLRDAAREAERHQDTESTTSESTEWTPDTRGTMSTPMLTEISAKKAAEQQEVQHGLESDLDAHTKLMQSLSVDTEGRDIPVGLTSPNVQAGWQNLSRRASEKKMQVQEKVEKPPKLERRKSAFEPMIVPSENVKQSVGDVLECLDNVKQIPAHCKNTLKTQKGNLQQKYQNAMEEVTSWLDNVEAGMYSLDPDKNPEEQLQDSAATMDNLQAMKQQLVEMKEMSPQILQYTDMEAKPLVRQALADVEERLKTMEMQARQLKDELGDRNQEWAQFQDDAKSLHSKLEEAKQELTVSPQDSLEHQIATTKKLEGCLKQYEIKLLDLANKVEELQDDSMGSLPSELIEMQDLWQELSTEIIERKSFQHNAATNQSQYERMIEEYAEFLETAEQKLKTDAMSATDLNHLRQQLKAHKDFFSGLESHKATLDSLAKKVDPATRIKFKPLHDRLNGLTVIDQDRASLKGQKMEQLLHQWETFNTQFNDSQKLLGKLQKQVPPSGETDDSVGQIKRAIEDYHALQSKLTEEKPSMYQIVDKGRQLLKSVTCPGVEGCVTDFAESWLNLNNKAMHEVQSLESVVDLWERFNQDSELLTNWLSLAQARVEDIGQLNEDDLADVGAIREKTDKFLDFRKEVENQVPVKSRVSNLGHQLLRTRKADSADVRRKLELIEDQWIRLMCQIPNYEQQLHSAQMDLLPSRQALAELLMWIEGVQKVLNEDKNKGVDSLMETELMLQKYKGFKIDLNNKQLTVDFVNQSVTQMSLEKGHKDDKTEFAEKLGQLNKQWQSVSSDIIEKIKTLELLQARWEEYDKAVKGLLGWFDDQEKRVKKYHRIGHEVSVQHSLRECKNLDGQLKKKEDEIECAKKAGMALASSAMSAPASQRTVKTTIDKLNQKWATLDHQVRQLVNNLEDILHHWDAYHQELLSVSQILTEADYVLSRYHYVSGDVDSFRNLVFKLRGMQAEFEQHNETLTKFTELASHLVQVCEPVVSQGLQKTVTDTQTRWTSNTKLYNTKIHKFQTSLEQWEKYEVDYASAFKWIDVREKRCAKLLLLRDDLKNKQHHLEESKQLQEEVEEYQDVMNDLGQLSDSLTPKMDNTTIVSVTSRETELHQRLLTLRQTIAKHVHNLNTDFLHEKRFLDAFAVVEEFLAHAGYVLASSDPNKHSDQAAFRTRLGELKMLAVEFANNQSQLDALNGIGYRLSLNETDSIKLKTVNQKWQNLFGENSTRLRSVQANLLLQQSFQQKCESWMAFLAQTEQCLAVDIAGNYKGLVEQQKTYEVFQAEFFGRQQILQSIISDGHKMMQEGTLEDQQDFQRKLTLLDQQWQGVTKRANQRKAIIDSNLAQWQNYNTTKEKLTNWLKETDEGLAVFDVATLSLHKVRSLLEQLKTFHKDVSRHEPKYQKVQECGRMLIHISDKDSEQQLHADLSNIQQQWFQVIGKVDGRREHLDGVMKLWNSCENNIEDILSWLKDIRRSLNFDLPETYDDLQNVMHRCKEYEASFALNNNKRESLASAEQQLALAVNSEDVTILRQRITLLNKQWDELFNQVSLQKHHINDRLYQWTSFNEKNKEMNDWLNQMEARVSSSKEYHIEDLLQKLEKDYKEEMKAMDNIKQELFAHGEKLKKASSEIRANDIAYKMSKLEDKWQRLQTLCATRLKKLQETLHAVQQLDVSMSSLRMWLAHIEHELGSPLVYQNATFTEIQGKLVRQQSLQKDVEKHSTGVASVLNLCEVLLHDRDACPTEVETDAIKHAMKSLDKRWRNICALSMERRLRIEETWRLWQKFSGDFKHYYEWLKDIEKEAIGPDSDNISLAKAKGLVKKFEALQRKLHEHLAQLELINKQYRKLAREGRTDSSNNLKENVQDVNDLWDKLSSYMTTVLRRLKHSLQMVEDFTSVREAELVWFTELDLQLTNVQHFSNMTMAEQAEHLKTLEKEIEEHQRKIQFIEQCGTYLLQKCDQNDAVEVQNELDEFKQYTDEVMSRFSRFQERVKPPSSEDEDSFYSDDDVSLNLPDDFDEVEVSPGRVTSTSSKGQTANSGSQSQGSRQNGTGRRGSNDSLDWDMYDIEKSLEDSPSISPPTDSSPFGSPPSGSPPTQRRGPHTYQANLSQIKKQLSGKPEKLAEVEKFLEQFDLTVEEATQIMDNTDHQLRCKTPVGPEVDTMTSGYARLLGGCKSNLNKLDSIQKQMKEKSGLPTVVGMDTQVKGVVHRWQVLNARASAKDLRLEQSKHEWQQFRSDLKNILMWLDEAEAIQGTQLFIPQEIKQLEITIRRHKEFLLQLDHRKAIVLSINLLSRRFIDDQSTSAETKELKVKLKQMNTRWDTVCNKTTKWQKRLQGALMHSQEFHQTTHDLLLWLESVENEIKKMEPVQLESNKDELLKKYNRFKDMKAELEKSQPRVFSLKDTSDQLLVNTEASDALEAKEKIHVISNRLKSLLRLCTSYVNRLGASLGLDSETISPIRLDVINSASPRTSTPRSSRSGGRSPLSLSRQFLGPLGKSHPDNVGENSDELHRRRPFLYRVLRTALPLQILMLLLVGIACLVPMCEEGCGTMNNFERSFLPVLRYSKGPPPV